YLDRVARFWMQPNSCGAFHANFAYLSKIGFGTTVVQNRRPVMSSRHRRYFSPEAKVAIVRRNLLDGLTELDVCKANKLNRSVLRRWKIQLLQNGASAFRREGEESDQRQNVAAQGNGKPRAGRDQHFEEALTLIIRPHADVAEIVKRA